MRILVLGGGNSPERDVSLRSAQAVADALEAAGFTVDRYDPTDGFGFLDSVSKDTIIFPILHGAEGEDGVIQAEMEKRGLAFLGTKSKESYDCFDKELTRQRLRSAGLPVADGASINAEQYRSHPIIRIPHVLKVQRGGSSIGTYVVHNPEMIDWSKVDYGFSLDSQAIIEELVEGVEITVPVLDGRALPVIEIRPPEHGEFDYENKYNGKTAEICPAESIGEDAQKIAQSLAEKVHQTMGCRHLSRTDIIVRPNGEMVILEINTMPGMTNQSLFPLAARVAGMPMPELMRKFVSLVQRDYP